MQSPSLRLASNESDPLKYGWFSSFSFCLSDSFENKSDHLWPQTDVLPSDIKDFKNNNIDISDGMWPAMMDSLQTKRKNLQVFCDKWNNDLNSFLCTL